MFNPIGFGLISMITIKLLFYCQLYLIIPTVCAYEMTLFMDHPLGSPGIQIKTINQFDDVTVLNRFTASSGSRVDLPCDLTIPSDEDSITLILWYKNDRKSPPIYSVDARNAPVERAAHFTADEFKNRAKFNLSVRPGLLTIDPVDQHDTGLYLCRVDFKWARTISTLNNLTVIEPAPTLDSCSISNQTPTSLLIECYHQPRSTSSNNYKDSNKIDKTYHVINNNSIQGYPVKPDELMPLPVDHRTSSSSSSSSSTGAPPPPPPPPLHAAATINGKINYFLEIYSSEKDKLISNLTSSSAKFTVNGLEPGTSYLIYAYSANAFTTSSPIIIRTRTLRPKKPEPPISLKSCSISNKTISSFNVTCFARNDNNDATLRDSDSNSSSEPPLRGDHRSNSINNFNDNSTNRTLNTVNSNNNNNNVNNKLNRFHVEIFNDKTKLLTDNLTNNSPQFTISGLEPGNSYTLYAYTSNNISKSLPVSVKVDLPSRPTTTEPAFESIFVPSLESCVISNQTVDSFLIECSMKQLTSLNLSSQFLLLNGYPSSSSSSSQSSLSSSFINEIPSSSSSSSSSSPLLLSDTSLSSSSQKMMLTSMTSMITFHLQVYHSLRNELIHNLTHSRPKFHVTGLEAETSYLVYAYAAHLNKKSDPIKLHVKTLKPIAQQQHQNQQDHPSVPLQSCSITNQTWGSFIVECIPGKSSSTRSPDHNDQSLSFDNHKHLPSTSSSSPSSSSSSSSYLSVSPPKQQQEHLHHHHHHLHPHPDPSLTTPNTWPNITSLSYIKQENLSSTIVTGDTYISNHNNDNDNDNLSSENALNPSSRKENSVNIDIINNGNADANNYNDKYIIYHLEVFSRERDKLLYNMTNSSPIFVVSGLEPSTSYQLYIYTSNMVGYRSSPLILKSGTLTMMTRKQDYIHGNAEIFDSRILILVLGSSCLLLLLALVILIILKIRKRDAMISNRKRSHTNSTTHHPNSGPHSNTMTRSSSSSHPQPGFSPGSHGSNGSGSIGCLTSLTQLSTHLSTTGQPSSTLTTGTTPGQHIGQIQPASTPTLESVLNFSTDTLKDKLKGDLSLTSTFTGYGLDGLTLRSSSDNNNVNERVHNQANNGSNKSFLSSETNNPLTIDVDHQQPKWILVNTTANPDVIPTKVNLSQGNSGNCSNLVNSRLLDGCPISQSPLSGTLTRTGVASIKVDPNVLNGAYNVPHVRLISNRSNQSQLILTPSNTHSPELSIFSEETFEEPNIVSFSTAV